MVCTTHSQKAGNELITNPSGGSSTTIAYIYGAQPSRDHANLRDVEVILREEVIPQHKTNSLWHEGERSEESLMREASTKDKGVEVNRGGIQQILREKLSLKEDQAVEYQPHERVQYNRNRSKNHGQY